jgi:hypothetical protein
MDMFQGSITRVIESSQVAFSYSSSSRTSPASIRSIRALSNVCVRPASQIIELRLMTCVCLYRMYVDIWYPLHENA